MKRVYFIKPVGMDGPIKIGCSQSPGKRRDTLDTWSPFALEIVAETEGHFDLEQAFHVMFEESHQRREWFTWSPRLQQTIDEINAGTFDYTSLPAPRRIIGRVVKRVRRPRSINERYRTSAMARMQYSPSDWTRFYHPRLRAVIGQFWGETHWIDNFAAVEQIIQDGGGKPSKMDWQRLASEVAA